VAAELGGWGDRLGRIAPGYLADLIAVEGNPGDDLAALDRVRLVIAAGRVIVERLRPTARRGRVKRPGREASSLLGRRPAPTAGVLCRTRGWALAEDDGMRRLSARR
jgi:cytosine/adenosine deaminase-related metal-dependent hydrolase